MKNKKIPKTVGDVFIDEVTEELRADNLKLFWKKHGFYLTLAMVIILTVTVSFETIKGWRIKKFQTWSDTYATALSLQNQGRFNESLAVLERIRNDAHDIYAGMAELQEANVLFAQGESGAALGVLEKIVKEKDINPKIYNVAVITLASYKLDTAPAEEILALLEPIIQENGSWTNIAKEMKAMLAIREGNNEQAKQIYTEILASGKINEEMQSRVKDMISVL